MVDEQKLRQLAEAAKPWQMDTAGQTDEQQEEGTASVGVMNGDGEFLAVAVVDTGLYDMPALALPLAEYVAESNPAAILSLLDELQTLRAAVKQARIDAMEEAKQHLVKLKEQSLAAQTKDAAPMTFADDVNKNIRLATVLLAGAIDGIESLKGTP